MEIRPTIAEAYETLLARHLMAVGASGFGKSRCVHHVLREHLRAGGSALLVDPKGETIDNATRDILQLGLQPEQVTVPRPGTGSVPGWNPLLTAFGSVQVATDVAAVIRQSSASLGHA
jgi:hypothetical protein